MDLIILGLTMVIAIILIALIIKENLDFKKRSKHLSNVDYRTRLNREFEIYEDDY